MTVLPYYMARRWAGAGLVSAPTLAYHALVSDITLASSWAAGTLAIGDAAAGKLIIVPVACWNFSSAGRTVTAITVGGVSLTERIAITGERYTAIWAGVVTGGPTAAFQLTFSNTCNRKFVGSYSLLDYVSATEAGDHATSGVNSLSLAHSAGSVAVVGAVKEGSTVTTDTFSNGVTRDAIAGPRGGAGSEGVFMVGSKVLTSAGTLVTVSSGAIATSRHAGAVWA